MGYISVSGTGFAERTRGWGISLAKAGAAAGLFAALAGTSPSARLDVNVERMRSDEGMLHICVTRDDDYFPDCEEDPDRITRSIRADGSLTARFTNLPSGGYAVSIVHDENSNDRLDRFAGIPREGIGFSRNPRFTFGPPAFSAARFTLSNGEGRQDIRMRYFL